MEKDDVSLFLLSRIGTRLMRKYPACFTLYVLGGGVFISMIFSSCTVTDVVVGGAPGWFADGMKISDEPPPQRPDPAIMMHERESGVINFQAITEDTPEESDGRKRKKRKYKKSEPFLK